MHWVNIEQVEATAREALACEQQLALVAPTVNEAAPPTTDRMATCYARILQLETNLAATTKLYDDVVGEADLYSK